MSNAVIFPEHVTLAMKLILNRFSIDRFIGNADQSELIYIDENDDMYIYPLHGDENFMEYFTPDEFKGDIYDNPQREVKDDLDESEVEVVYIRLMNWIKANESSRIKVWDNEEGLNRELPMEDDDES